MSVVAAAILAAGSSSRLGQPKQLVRFGGEALLERAVRLAEEAGCAPVLVILGAHAEEIRSSCRLGSATVLFNPDWAEGMASSLRAAVRATPPTADALLLMACDQPAVSAEHLRRLAALAIDEPVASAYAGRRGVPACIPGKALAPLLAVTGDQGARDLLRDARTLDLPWGEVDIDTPESLGNARRLFRNGNL